MYKKLTLTNIYRERLEREVTKERHTASKVKRRREDAEAPVKQ